MKIIRQLYPMHGSSGQLARSALSKWNHDKFGNIDRRIDELQAQMNLQFKKDGNRSGNKLASILLEDLLLKQESLWKQKSHEQHVKLGDKNTRFFHQKLKRDKQKNSNFGS